MELKIKSPTQAKPFARQIDFLPDKIVLHADTDIVLAYAETTLEIVLRLEISPDLALSSDKKLYYKPFIQRFIFNFSTSQTSYQIEHAGTMEQLFSLLEKKFPFQAFIITFQNQHLDAPRQQLATAITQIIEEYKQTGQIKKLPKISVAQALYPTQKTVWIENNQISSPANSTQEQALPEETENYPLFNLFLCFCGIIISAGITFYLYSAQETLLQNLPLVLISGCLGIGSLYALIVNIKGLCKTKNTPN